MTDGLRERGDGGYVHHRTKRTKTIAFVIYHVDFIENLGIPYLSTVAKNKGWNVELIIFDKNTIDDDFRRVDPEIVGYNSMSADSATYLAINRYLKEKFDFVSVMGGPHPTYFPDVRFEESLDFICRGEGEEPLAEFLERFDRGDDLDSIQNFGSRRGLNPLRPLIADLDTLPAADRDLTFTNTELGKSRLKIFMASRGCPFTCTYCFNQPLNMMYKGLGKRWRVHSPERIVSDVDSVRSKYPLSFIKFQDDLFGAKTSWLAEFAEVYRRHVGIPFNALERLDLVTPERLRLFKEAGCKSLTFAIDSANPRIRTEILERGMKIPNEEIARKLRMVRDHGIHTMTNFILGTPTSTVQDELDAVELSVQGKVSLSITSTLVPYPGTKIFDYCMEHKLLDGIVKPTDGKRPVIRISDDVQFSSIQKRSILNSFTDAQKDVLFNISTVFSLMVVVPWLRRLLYSMVKHVKPNLFLAYGAIVAKGYRTDRYIYPTRMPFTEKLRFLFKALRIEGGRMMGMKKEGGGIQVDMGADRERFREVA